MFHLQKENIMGMNVIFKIEIYFVIWSWKLHLKFQLQMNEK